MDHLRSLFGRYGTRAAQVKEQFSWKERAKAMATFDLGSFQVA